MVPDGPVPSRDGGRSGRPLPNNPAVRTPAVRTTAVRTTEVPRTLEASNGFCVADVVAVGVEQGLLYRCEIGYADGCCPLDDRQLHDVCFV